GMSDRPIIKAKPTASSKRTHTASRSTYCSLIQDYRQRSDGMHFPDIVRYSLWSGVLIVSVGNRRFYSMTTTWLPHLTANTVSLLLPEIYRFLDTLRQRLDRHAPALARPHGRWQLLGDTLETMVRDNPRYVLYVAPLAAGYLLSSPWFNIYKGKLAERRLAGFGLDAIPHITTAFALTRLVSDTADAAA